MLLLLALVTLTIADHTGCARFRRDIGYITDIMNLPSCPPNFTPGMSCKQVTVHCEDTADINVTYGVLYPCGYPMNNRGTVITFGGGSGTAPLGRNYTTMESLAGFTVVDMAFQGRGWNPTGIGMQNLKTSACRPATMARYLYETVHGADTTRGFCAQGHSGGSTAIGYLMAWYGGDEYLDFGLQLSGVNFANMTAGCVTPFADPVTVCPGTEPYCGQVCESFLGDVSFANTFGPTACYQRGISLTGYPCACPNITSTPEMIQWWNSQNIIGPCADTYYKHTGLAIWSCKPPTNIEPGQGELFARSVYAENGVTEYLVTNCSGTEGIWNGVFLPTGASGLTASVMSLIQGCVPHHRDCDEDC